jgi:proteasome lid subunit RPN8/RPN11
MDNIEPFLTKDTRNALALHMLDDLEVERCGLITLSKIGEYEFHPVENVHEEPEKAFRLSKEDSARVMQDKDVVAFCHTHPNGPLCPSEKDVEVQARLKKPSVICARDPGTGIVDIFSLGDHLLDAPLYKRVFRYNTFDCLGALRSWVWQTEGRYMPPMPYEPGWWLVGFNNPEELPNNPNLYEKHFRRYGYKPFSPVFDDPTNEYHPRPGDVLMMMFGVSVVNHVAVYKGDDLIYHHRVDHMSCDTPLGYLIGNNVVRRWVRYEGSDEQD